MTVQQYHPTFVRMSKLYTSPTPRNLHPQQIGIYRTPANAILVTSALDDNPSGGDFVVAGTESKLFRSTDGGATWTTIDFTGYSVVLFNVGSDIFAMTMTEPYGGLQIRKSTDDGLTWGTATTLITNGAANGSPNMYVTAPRPLIYSGRIYVPVTDTPDVSAWFAKDARLSLMHAATSDDLLDSGSWTQSSYVVLSGGVTTGDTETGFVEPNILLDLNGDPVIVTRVKSDSRLNICCIVNITPGASASLSYTAATDIRTMLGGHTMFSISIEDDLQEYFSIVNRNTLGSGVYNQRTCLTLIRSDDLTTWTQVADIVRCHNFENTGVAAKEGIQYCDWMFDGDDIVGIIRVAELGLAINYHQATHIYFFRIKDYIANLFPVTPTNTGESPSSPYAAVTRNGVAV
jgi:hypothetical protein